MQYAKACGSFVQGLLLCIAVAACSETTSLPGNSVGGNATGVGGNATGVGGVTTAGGVTSRGGTTAVSATGGATTPVTNVAGGPPAGDPNGTSTIPAEAGPASTTAGVKHVVGAGTPASCTGDAFIAAVALGGVITFDCGPSPVTITLTKPAKIFNDTTPEIVIDGGGLVTLSGGGTTRILYMNTCDEAQHWTSPNCNNQDSPHLAVQNLTFVNANSKGETEYDGGGAIWVRGGRFKVNSSRFF